MDSGFSIACLHRNRPGINLATLTAQCLCPCARDRAPLCLILRRSLEVWLTGTFVLFSYVRPSLTLRSGVPQKCLLSAPMEFPSVTRCGCDCLVGLNQCGTGFPGAGKWSPPLGVPAPGSAGRSRPFPCEGGRGGHLFLHAV